MNWFYTVVISVCVAVTLGMILSGIEGSSGIFRCVRLVISLVLSLYVISVCLNADFTFLGNIKAEDFKTDSSKYSEGVLKSFNENLEKGVIKEIESLYPDSEATAYVISKINEKYEIDIINLSVSIRAGDINKISNMIHENYGIEKEKIFIQRE